MSKEFLSAVRGSGVGLAIGLINGIATLGAMGFDHITFFEGALLASFSAFGGAMFGALIGVTGAFRKDELEATQLKERHFVQKAS